MAFLRGDDGVEFVKATPDKANDLEQFVEALKEQLIAQGEPFRMAINVLWVNKRKKVISDLEKCIDDSVAAVVPTDTVEEALALLKAQEPRVMTLEEVLENAQEIGFPCWVEDHIEDIGTAFLFPAVVTSDDIYVQYTGNAYYEGAIYHRDYNKRLRCWTSRPTEEQREATAWND